MLFLRVVEWAGSAAFLVIAAVVGMRLPTDWMIGLVIALAFYACPILVWAFVSAAVGAFRRDLHRVLWSIGLVIAAVPAFFIGGSIADRLFVAYYAPMVRAAMTAEGRTGSYAYPLDGMVIVYDEIDSDDPAELSRAGRIGHPDCEADARRIAPHYYVADEEC